MVIFPNCKINLGLRILGKRNDGYHDLETVFYPLAIKDAIEIIEDRSTHNIERGISYSHSGLAIDGNEQDNLCVKAYRLLKKDFPSLPAIKFHLHKNIPMGAGLGGGSSDAAYTLKALNKKFSLNISEEGLVQYALQLGSDCPFFMINKPCLAQGRGELMNTIELDLSAYSIVVINPGIHISTAWAFANVNPAPAPTLSTIIQQPIDKWKNELLNDFEKPVFEKHPEIKDIKENLYDAGAVYASMSGSGSTVYGIFKRHFLLPKDIIQERNYRVEWIEGKR